MWTKYSFLIVMAIYVIYHVVTNLMQEAAKKQKQEGMDPPPPTPPAAGMGQAPIQPQAGPAAALRLRPGVSAIREARIDDLSARRRSQLDQLRARRESRRTAPPAEVRVGGPAAGPRTTGTGFPPGLAPTAGTGFPPGLAPTTGPGFPPGLAPTTPRTIPPVQPRREEFRAAQRAERLERAERLQRVERGLAAAKRKRLGVEPPKLDIEPIREPPGRVAQEPRAAYAIGPRRRGGRAGRLLSQLHDPASLRDLFVLKEVLDPPVAMRGPDAR